MQFSLYENYGARNSGPIFDAVKQGLKHHGHSVSSHDGNADVAVIWSQLWYGRMCRNQLIFESFRKKNKPVVVIDVGVLERNKTWRFSLNAEHRFLLTKQDSTRARKLGLNLEPWHQTGSKIVIAMQSHHSQQWSGMPAPMTWLTETVTTIRQHTDLPIHVRPHPRNAARFDCQSLPSGCVLSAPVYLPNTYDCFDFEQSIQDAWAVINWNSNPGVAACINGIPAFVGGTSLAAPVGNTEFNRIADPIRPDRSQWLNDLAWHEWYESEIRNGEALVPLIGQLLIEI